ncbi:MAG: MBL fold metallo-hydrolase [Nocardioides sp.]
MSWGGGRFGERAQCVLAPNANMMTLDGTNTWVLREPGARRSVVIDPGPKIASHLDTVAEVAGDVAVVLLTHGHHDHSEAARSFAERMGCGVRALDPTHRLGGEGLVDGDVVSVDGLEVQVVGTPGHSSDSL